MLICSPNNTVSTDPVFRIQNNLIVRKPKAKYLGHIIKEDMSDDVDVFRQVKCLYIRGNIISRKFANCSINVKLVVFKSLFCVFCIVFSMDPLRSEIKLYYYYYYYY